MKKTNFYNTNHYGLLIIVFIDLSININFYVAGGRIDKTVGQLIAQNKPF